MSNPVTRALPSNVDVEQAILGGILLEPSALYRLELRGTEFYLEKHREIYTAMLDCARADREPNFLNVLALLTERKQLKEGPAYLTSLLNGVATAANVEQAAELVQRSYAQRALIHTATELAELGYAAGEMQTDEMLTKAHTALQSLEIAPQERGVPMSESARAVADEVDDLLSNPRETYGVPTHLDIDRVTNGLGPGDLVIVVGDPGMGKTALVHQMILNMAQDNVRARLYSFEMPHKKVTLRMACNLAGVNSRLVRKGELTDEQADDVRRALGIVSALPLRVVDAPCSSEQMMMDLARAERAGQLPQVVAIDYSKLMTDKGDNEVIRVGNITRQAKVMAMRFSVAVVMVHVLNGDPAREGRMPELRDLGWARQSQYDPDIVLATRLHEGKADVGILKNREGEWGNGLGVSMAFLPDYTRWGNLARVPEPPRRRILSPVPTFDDIPMVEEREYA